MATSRHTGSRGRGADADECDAEDGRRVYRWRADVVWHSVATRYSEPGPVDACESPQGVVIFEESPPHQIVEVSEAPGNQPGSRDVEEDIEGPRVDVDPAELSAEHDGDTLPA